MKFNNTAGVSQDMTLSGESFSPDLKPKWFKGFSGSKNITDDVMDGTYEFTAQSGQTKKFRIKVKALEDGIEECVVTYANDADMIHLGVVVSVNTDICP